MDDVRAVMDAAGSERAALFGYSEGGPMSVLFAATYPARTRALVLYGTYAKRLRSDDYPWAPTWEERVAVAAGAGAHWGESVDLGDDGAECSDPTSSSGRRAAAERPQPARRARPHPHEFEGGRS